MLLDPDGRQLCNVKRDRILWYLKRGLAELLHRAPCPLLPQFSSDQSADHEAVSAVGGEKGPDWRAPHCAPPPVDSRQHDGVDGGGAVGGGAGVGWGGGSAVVGEGEGEGQGQEGEQGKKEGGQEVGGEEEGGSLLAEGTEDKRTDAPGEDARLVKPEGDKLVNPEEEEAHNLTEGGCGCAERGAVVRLLFSPKGRGHEGNAYYLAEKVPPDPFPSWPTLHPTPYYLAEKLVRDPYTHVCMRLFIFAHIHACMRLPHTPVYVSVFSFSHNLLSVIEGTPVYSCVFAFSHHLLSEIVGTLVYVCVFSSSGII